MKKLSYLTNVILLALLMTSCSNNKPNKKSENQSADEKPQIENSVSSIDTTKNKGTIMQSKTIETKTDTLNKDQKYSKGDNKVNEAPKHNSPDQSTIDSIKKSKEKLKK